MTKKLTIGEGGDQMNLRGDHTFEFSATRKFVNVPFAPVTMVNGKWIRLSDALLTWGYVEQLGWRSMGGGVRVIKKVGEKYCVFSKAGKNLGCHDTLEKAKAQLAAIEASKKKGKKNSEGTMKRRVIVFNDIRQVGEESDRTLRFIGTTETPDRYNTIIRVDGWDLHNFMRNPVFMWSHQHSDPPIARVIAIEKRTIEVDARDDDEEGKGKRKVKALVFDVQFADRETYPFADIIYGLYKKGFLHATSVGFHTLKQKEITDEEELANMGLKPPRGFDLIKNELMELSGCPIPGQAEALIEKVNEMIPAGVRSFATSVDGESMGAWLEDIRMALVPT